MEDKNKRTRPTQVINMLMPAVEVLCSILRSRKEVLCSVLASDIPSISSDDIEKCYTPLEKFVVDKYVIIKDLFYYQ